jgi:hypothetical protein
MTPLPLPHRRRAAYASSPHQRRHRSRSSFIFLTQQPYIKIYFRNTQMKQLQQTSEKDETFGI